MSERSEKAELPAYKDQVRSSSRKNRRVRPGAIATHGNQQRNNDPPGERLNFKDQARDAVRKNESGGAATRAADNGAQGTGASGGLQADDHGVGHGRPGATQTKAGNAGSSGGGGYGTHSSSLPSFKDQADDRVRSGRQSAIPAAGNSSNQIRTASSKEHAAAVASLDGPPTIQGPAYKDQVRIAPGSGTSNEIRMNAAEGKASAAAAAGPLRISHSRSAGEALEVGQITQREGLTGDSGNDNNNDNPTGDCHLVHAELVDRGLTIAEATPVRVARRRLILVVAVLLVVVVAIAVAVSVTLVLQQRTNDTVSENDEDTSSFTNMPTMPPTAEPTTPLTEPLREWIQLGDDSLYWSEDEAGSSIALSRNGLSMVVGAPGFEAAYVYRYETHATTRYDNYQNEWVLYATLTGNAVEDGFLTDYDAAGRSVAVDDSGTIVAVGAPSIAWEPLFREDPIIAEREILPDASATGAVRVYQVKNRVGDDDDLEFSGEFEQQGSDIVGVESGGEFGFALSMSSKGNIIAAGARTACLVRVVGYSNDAKDWVDVGQSLDCSSGDYHTSFGSAVALSDNGKILAVGESHPDNETPGRVHVFNFNETSEQWETLGDHVVGSGSNDEFGTSVALSEDGMVLAIGAPSGDISVIGLGSGLSFGSCRVYQFTDGSWNQLGSDINDIDQDDHFGFALSLNAEGSVLAIGAPKGNSDNGRDSGYVQVYEYEASLDTWNQIGGNIPGPFVQAFGGSSVALSAQGDIVTIGSPNSGFNAEFSDVSGRAIVYGTGVVFETGGFPATFVLQADAREMNWYIERMDIERQGALILKSTSTSQNETNTTNLMLSDGGLYRIRLWVSQEDQGLSDNAEYSLYFANSSSDDNLRVIEGSGNFSVEADHMFFTAPLGSSQSRRSGERFITLFLDFEERPFDASWVLVASEVLAISDDGPVRSGRTVLAFGPSQRYSEANGTSYSEKIDVSVVSPRASLKLIFLDDGIDGFCCENGSASYRMYDGSSPDDALLFSSRTDRTRREVTPFSLSAQ